MCNSRYGDNLLDEVDNRKVYGDCKVSKFKESNLGCMADFSF